MTAQAAVDQLTEGLPVFGQKPGALLKGDPLGTVSAVVDHVAGGLVGQ